MTLDKEIIRYENLAEYHADSNSNGSWHYANRILAEEYRQLAEWLRELKRLMEQEPYEYKPFVIDKLKDEDLQKLLREFKNQQVLAVDNDRFPSVTIIKSCGNAISRNDMLDAIGHGTTYTSEELQKIIKGLPEAKAMGIQDSMLIPMIKSDLDNLDTYTIHMGASQQDKVCVEFKEVVKLLEKYRSEVEECRSD